MSSSTFAGNSDGALAGLGPALAPALGTALAPTPPPPPPPPPPGPGQVPTMRINTAETPASRRAQIATNDGYEPPAAIQNAMLTKDKKPFTYTPGMGGKLDLSQIRSPRMARRVAKNANDEGIEGPPKSALESKPTPGNPSVTPVFAQPQVAVPVFPANMPPPPPPQPSTRTPPSPQTPGNRFSANGMERAVEPPSPRSPPTKVETKASPAPPLSVASAQANVPESPTQVTLSKAPTPWLQNKNKPPEELPEWAKRAAASKQSPSPAESPVTPGTLYIPVSPAPPQPAAPSPFSLQQPPQSQQKRPASQTGQQERVIPMRIEDRPSVFDARPEAGHHQFKQPPLAAPSPHHQQRWGQTPGQNQVQAQTAPITVAAAPSAAQPSAGGGYIIPIMVEGSEKRPVSGGPPGSNTSYSQPVVKNSAHDNQTVKVVPVSVQQRGPAAMQQAEPGPLQSRSFRVLQKITDTDPVNDVDPDQLRKLQLTEDDRILMNKFKEQVDSDSFLHHEEDPRYRGAAIPSRAFRYLQTMTDGGEVPVASTAPRVQNTALSKKQNRNSKSFEESQANLPPSEQQVQEPKKYMGGAIPSRSFRILQAMTAPENIGPDTTDY